jgi:hypothetical protein
LVSRILFFFGGDKRCREGYLDEGTEPHGYYYQLSREKCGMVWCSDLESEVLVRFSSSPRFICTG